MGYICPLLKQAKQVAWDYAKHYSRPIPRVKINESELRIDYPNGGRLTLFGGDHPHNIRGIYLDDVVLDEYSYMSPILWPLVVRPALSDRRGRGLFAGTPFGRANLFREIHDFAEKTPGWYASVMDWKATGILPTDEIRGLKLDLTQEEFAQEYECSWSAAIKGAFYGSIMDEIERDGHITTVAWDETLPVHTAWDLGIRDTNVVGLIQVAGTEVRFIDCLAYQSTGLPDIIKELDSKPYQYGKHIGPPDIKVRELGSGKSRLEIAEKLGVAFEVCPQHNVADGIAAVRSMLRNCWFDRDKCHILVEALRQYRTEYDETKRSFRTNPLHDWTSHYADMVRVFAWCLEDISPWVPTKRKAVTQKAYW